MFFCYIVKTKQHYFICNSPNLWYGILRFQNAHTAEIPPFFISSLMDFLLCILFSFHSNSENHSCNFLKFCELWPIRWEYICYGCQLRKFWENCNLCQIFGVYICCGKFRLIHAIKLSNLDFKIVLLMFKGSSC